MLNGQNDISREFNISLKNKFAALQEKFVDITASQTYEYLVEACQTASTEYIPLKPKIRRKVPWENKHVQESRF